MRRYGMGMPIRLMLTIFLQLAYKHSSYSQLSPYSDPSWPTSEAGFSSVLASTWDARPRKEFSGTMGGALCSVRGAHGNIGDGQGGVWEMLMKGI